MWLLNLGHVGLTSPPCLPLETATVTESCGPWWPPYSQMHSRILYTPYETWLWRKDQDEDQRAGLEPGVG